MSFKEAISNGYQMGSTSFQRGYISRKTNTNDQPVKVAGGNRRGELYILLPNYDSTKYCIRQYLRKVQ